MTQSNPFSSDALNDSMGFVKNLWGGMGVPGMTVPTLSVDELDKRIQELKSVETWLNVNMTMLRNTIQALEVQRATLATLHSLSASMAKTMGAVNGQGFASTESTAATAPSTPVTSPFPSSSWPIPSAASGTAEVAAPTELVQEKTNALANDVTTDVVAPLVSQSAIWWNDLQEQFKQAISSALVSSTAAGTEVVKAATDMMPVAPIPVKQAGAQLHASAPAPKAKTSAKTSVKAPVKAKVAKAGASKAKVAASAPVRSTVVSKPRKPRTAL